MSKKLKDLKWETVPLEGFPASVTDKLQGFVGLEECTSYGLDRENKKPKKHKENANKRKREAKSTKAQQPVKKLKLSNGFIVETCNTSTPSLSNEIATSNVYEQKIKGKKPIKGMNIKKKKHKLGEATSSQSDVTPQDMLAWAEFQLPDSIMKALTEMGFKQPTKIQQLSLPAAIHGRRDILGAAETGSGKTLAFGLPILSGILDLKEKADQKGLDVYDIPYKKTSAKKKTEEKELKKSNKISKNKLQIKKDNTSNKDSEEGYGSSESTDKMKDKEKKRYKAAEDYLEEYEIPIKKRNDSDEGNDSDGENYVHLSDMLDSDDLKDESDDNEQSEDDLEPSENDQSDNDKNEELSDYGNQSDSNESDEGLDVNASDVDSTDDHEMDVGDGEDDKLQSQGTGLVKVVDDVKLPPHMEVRTGKPLYALILTPTRELAMQVSRHLMAVAKYTGIRIATIVGGLAAVKQERVLGKGPEIVVATPGRLWELLSQGQPHLQQLSTVKFLAIDETDRMIERGHFEELQPLLERLNADDDRRSTRQNFVFSATLTMVHELPAHMRGKKVTKRGKILNRKVDKMTSQQKINRLVKMIGMTDPKVVDITAQNLGAAETLTESRITCSVQHKDAYLYYVLKRHPGRTIVFCNSIGCVQRLAQLFGILKCHPLPLHANMQQRQRLKNLERFRDDKHGVLIATDVAARGLDIPDVDHVVHYQVPRTAESYVHRSGRTARASKEGLTILMMEPSEAFLYAKLCQTLNKKTELPLFPVQSHSLSPVKELVGLARDIDALELKKRRAAQSVGWREKAAKEMDMIVDDDDAPVKQIDPSIERMLRAKKRQLETAMARPLFPRGFSFKYPTLNDPTALEMPQENALQVMKNAIQSGELKKDKRKSKNAPLLKLGKGTKKHNMRPKKRN